jgi:DNA-binding NtrC family response regulator
MATVESAMPQSATSLASTSTEGGPLSERVDAFERQVLLAELKRHHYHITNTAKALGLERSHLYKKAEQLGIDLSAARREHN